MTTTTDRPKQTHPDYPAYAWPGAYPVLYRLPDGDVLCPACAGETREGTADIYWEGPPEVCVECRAAIEAAYGDPETEA